MRIFQIEMINVNFSFIVYYFLYFPIHREIKIALSLPFTFTIHKLTSRTKKMPVNVIVNVTVIGQPPCHQQAVRFNWRARLTSPVHVNCALTFTANILYIWKSKSPLIKTIADSISIFSIFSRSKF